MTFRRRSTRYRKRKLLQNLQKETFCRIAPSTIPGAGVGVIAIKDIPVGTYPFKRADSRLVDSHDRVIDLTDRDLQTLNPEVRRMVQDFFIPEKDYDKPGSITYPAVSRGLNGLDLSFYLNHSDNPNLDMVSNNSPYYEFRTNRPIKEGEELFIDYTS